MGIKVAPRFLSESDLFCEVVLIVPPDEPWRPEPTLGSLLPFVCTIRLLKSDGVVLHDERDKWHMQKDSQCLR
jgi:hypothetical protein